MNPFEYQGMNRRSNSREPQKPGFDEVFIDTTAQNYEMIEEEKERLNFRALGMLIILVFGILFFRLYYLQVHKGEHYRMIAEGNKSRIQYTLAPRGLILDREGRVIAGNVPSFELVLIPALLPKDENELKSLVFRLSNAGGFEETVLIDAINKMDSKSHQAQTVIQNLGKDVALAILGQANEFRGFAVQNNPIREYKDPFMFAHLTGYTGKISKEEFAANEGKNYLLNDYIGKSGIELFYEDRLRGVHGQKPSEIDAVGTFRKNLPEMPSIPGNNLVLSIDYGLQESLYLSLTSIMTKYRKHKAAAVASDPRTGEILALISLPGFDGNMFARGITSKEYTGLIEDPNTPLLNRVISGTYPPGSTVKPMLAIAALTEGIVEPHTKILDDGVIRVGSYTFYGYNRSGLGPMDVYSAIARSSDIYFYTIGGGNAKTSIKNGLGPDKLAEWYRKFNLGSVLGLDLPNEKPGLVPDPEWKKRVKNEPWYLGNTYHYSIGQADLLVTPIQVNNWTATIANGGKLLKPHILKSVVDENGNTFFVNEAELIRQDFLDPKWVETARQGMRQTVTAGSARLFMSLPVSSAGKTGTAQYISHNLVDTHAWYTAYAPSDNPEIAITVLVEQGGEGSTVAVPVVFETLKWWTENRYNK
jgi:penicillin-binding protein 2